MVNENFFSGNIIFFLIISMFYFRLLSCLFLYYIYCSILQQFILESSLDLIWTYISGRTILKYYCYKQYWQKAQDQDQSKCNTNQEPNSASSAFICSQGVCHSEPYVARPGPKMYVLCVTVLCSLSSWKYRKDPVLKFLVSWPWYWLHWRSKTKATEHKIKLASDCVFTMQTFTGVILQDI